MNKNNKKTEVDVKINLPTSGTGTGTQKGNNQKRKQNRGRSKNVRQAHPVLGNTPRKREVELFLNGLMFPDITGPIRVPRNGASTRTGLGMSSCFWLGGSTTAVTAIQGTAEWNQSAWIASATSVSTGFGATSNQGPGSAFPATTNIVDLNLVAQSFVISYTGAPLNVTGEILVGVAPRQSDLTNVTFNGMSFYPGFLRIPLSSLIDNPIRISGRKISPAADEFLPTSSPMVDVEVPWVIIGPTAAANVVTIKMVATWEYRSTLTSGNVVPYEKTTTSFASDVAALQDAASIISEQPSLVTNAEDGYFMSLAKKIGIGMVTSTAVKGASWALGSAVNYHMNRLRGSAPFLSNNNNMFTSRSLSRERDF